MYWGPRDASKIANLNQRIKALLIDYFWILAYLLVLFALNLFLYIFIFGGWTLTHLQSQLVVTFTTVIPIIIIFSIKEGTHLYASFGKQAQKLKVIYRSTPLLSSFLRNILKFLPWQLGHVAVISGMYLGFDEPISVVTYVLSIALLIIYIVMVIFRKDRRHLADMIARAEVVKL